MLSGDCGDFEAHAILRPTLEAEINEVSTTMVGITALSRRLGLGPKAIRRLEQIGCFAAHVPLAPGQTEWRYRLVDVDAWLLRATDGRLTVLDDVAPALAG
ncbi:hypothetical protein DWV00_29680 [Trinickia dinghuensis]|uniref:DNA-binding protein n=1 Tax=Trinickia dinghuensis TaxID=2291023 RepID=A0A3D8JQI8_9BURK|nr:hypothetical protein DWV00_29680 [Trinickia dinghuensis]